MLTTSPTRTFPRRIWLAGVSRKEWSVYLGMEGRDALGNVPFSKERAI